MEHVVERAREVGYVTTIFGRRRYLNDIASRNAVARGLAERNAVNAPIQGSAADIMKIAMVHIAEAFRREGIRSQMILQVHDEVVIDTLRSELDRVREIVTEAMEQAAHLKVKLITECGRELARCTLIRRRASGIPFSDRKPPAAMLRQGAFYRLRRSVSGRRAPSV